MLPYIQIIIPTYALMVVIGFGACLAFLLLRNKKYQFSKTTLVELGVFSVIGMLVGSKLIYMISKIPMMIQGDLTLPELFGAFLFGGFVFYGGLLGAIGSLAVYSKIKKVEFNRIMNFILPGFILFHAFGRIGCFLGGCCYGMEISWGIMYHGVRRIPVQLVESAFEMGIVVYLLSYEDSLHKQQDVPKYYLLQRYLIMYPTIRFLLEFIRGDSERGFFGIFSTSQWISLILLCSVIMYSFLQSRRQGEQVYV